MGLVYNTKNGTYEYELANKILQKPTDIPKKKSKKNNAKVPSSKKQENINYFDDGYDFGDVTRTGIQLGKNLVKTPENFKDGYQFGDITKTIGASALDLGAGTVKAIMNHGESGIADPLQYGVAQVSDWMGFDKFANAVRENAKQNGVEQTFAPIDKLTDKYTAIGTTGDQLSSSIGNVIAMANASALLKAKGLPSSVNVGKFAMPITSIASGIGSGMTEAYNNGASDGEAWTYGALSGLAEGFSESLFGGLGKKFNLNVGEGGLDDFLIKRFTDKISNKTLRILAESGLKATGEGVEEILSGIGSAVSKKLTYLSKEDLKTLIKDENLAEQFIMGTLTSLISQTPGTIQSVKTGTDLITGQPTNNQALTLENMQENVPYTVKNNKGNAIAPLGNNVLNNTVLNENNQPYNVLNDGKEYAPYVPINNTFRYKKSTNPKINALNESMVKNNFDNSIESKSLSEVASVIIKDKGWNVLFDNTITNKKGESVNALVTTENGEITIRVNPNSTRAAEFLIIHEVTHGIETSELLKLANDYASKNPEFAKVMESLKTKYSEKDINSEVLADISGQLFGNQDFINSLVQDGSIQNKNIITKIYDAIKRLLNSLTEKGRQKNAYYDFVSELEQKWREAYKQTTTERAIYNLNDKTKYHTSANLSDDIDNVLTNIKERNPVRLRDFTPSILVQNGIKDLPMYENPSHIRKNILTKKEAQKIGLSVRQRDHYHGLGKGLYIKVIDSLDNPRVIFKNKNNKDYLILTITKDNRGNNIVVPIEIETTTDVNKVSVDINRIKTIYGYDKQNPDLNGYIKKNIKLGNFKKIYEQKKEPSTGINTAVSSFSANNIPQSNKTVKSSISTKYSMQELENNSSNNNNLKQQQLDIILNNNPAEDNYHTWIRNIDDIKTFEESLQDNDYAGWETDGFIPDYDANIVKQALKTGKITVYSSYPIEQGIFVTPSKMEAESYSGNGKIYSKEVNLKDVAWIDPTQGQYAKVDISNTKFSIDEIKDNQIQGLEDYTKPQIKNITTNYIKNALEYANVQADIVGMEIIGSRNRGTAKSNSDLDIVVELKGDNLREDDLFNLLNDTDEPLEINGIKVDINPIIAEKSGTLKEFMKRSNDYDKEHTKYSLNKDNKGRTLTKEQQEYFKDSKVRDENGSLIEVYHRTYKGGFTKFNGEVNFFTNDPNADFYGNDKYNVYLNIKNPLIIEGNGKNYNSLEFNEDGVKQYKTTTIENAINNMGKITKSDVVAIAKAVDSNNSLEDYIDEFNSSKEALDSVVDAYTEGGTLEDFVKQYGSLNIYIDNGNIKTKNVTTTRDITEYAKKKGYDGVIFKNIQDKTNGTADVYATLESPNQIKNVDNINPTDNSDIRYSQENKTWKEHLEENYEATGTRTYMPDHITDDYELWQDELNEILEKAKSVDEKLYNDIKQQNEEYRDRHRLEYRIYEETRSRQVGSEVNNDFFKEHFSDYDEQSGTKQADGIMTSIKLKKGNNLAKLSFTEGKDVIWIDELYVKNKNQGYGTEIVEAIKKYANENGKYVETHIELSTAEGFWDKTLRSNKNKNDDTKYSLNKDNKGRTLTKEQQNYFKNVSNELKDENGNLKTLYHGSRNDFTIFDLEKSGESNKNARVGFWFTESKEGAENFANSIWYGENEKANAYEVYLNIKNPKVYEKNDYTERKEKLNSQLNKLNERKKVFDEKYHISSFITSYEGEDFLRVVGMMTSPYSTYTDEEYKQYIKGMVDKGTDVEQYFNEVKEYSKIKQETKKLEKELSGLRYNDPYEQFRTDIYKIVGKDAEDANIGGSGMALNDEKGTLEAFRNSLIEQGYDGIVIKNTVYDSKTMGGENNQYVAFYPNQIKNVDNLNPTDSDDIRYSMIEDPIEISKLKKEDANTTPKAPYVKLSDNTKRDGNSKHYSNLTEKSKFLNDKSVNAISNETGVKYYDTMTNQEVLKQAKKELDNGGSKETLKWFAKEPTHATPSDIAKGWILLKQYQDKGDYDSVVQVAKKMRLMGTTTGRTLQMYAIMERLTPQGMVKYAQAELSEAFEEMVKNKSKAWIDKYKSDFELTPSETKFIMDTMLEVSKMKDGYEKNVKLAEIQKLMTDKLPPEKGAGIKAWMRISMLFNPKTQVRNVLGNTVIAPVNAVSDVFASGIDKMVSKKTGVRTTGSINLKSYTSGFKQGLYESYNDFKKGINTRNVEGNRFEIGEGKSFNDKTLIGHKLNQVDNLLSFMLDAGDRGFYEAAFTNSINNQMILNNTKTVTPEMIDIATTEALQRTWQDNNEYTRFVLNTRKGLNKLMSIGNYGLGDILIPFAKTPANLTKAIVDYSPVGLVHSLVEGHNLKNAIETGQFTAQQQHKFVQDLGKAVAGTMLYVIGYALANAGAISGKNDEDKDTANFMKNTLGISPYSIKIGNKTFTYDWAQPVAAPFAIMSDFMSSNDEDASILEKSISAFNTGFNIVVEQSFMQSIKTVLDNNDGIATGIQEAIMELPSRAIPTLSKQIVDLTDGTQRQTFVYGKPLETAKNKVLAKIPGTSKALAPTVDTMGREIKKYGGKNNIFNVFFNPANVNNENISKSAGEIYRLYQETGRTDLMPRVSPYYINHKGEKIVLSNENKSRFQKISGDIIEQNVQKIMKSSQYQYLSDEEKADIIQDIVNYSYNKARFDVLGIEMSDTYQSVADYEDIGGNLSDYYLFQSSINNENSETKKQSISSFLIQSNLSDKEISYLYNKYYSSDKTMNMLSNFKIPIKEYIKLNLQSFESDYNQNGKAISGSKQAKIFNYINSLKLNATQKAILMKMQYKSFKKYDKQILNYINNMNATRFEKASFAKQIGFDYYDDYLINYILKQNTSNEEKINQLKNLGFRYINGKIYK